jgi:hypothetical protein
MRNVVMVSEAFVAVLLVFSPLASAQSQSNTVVRPGLEVPLITPGPGWKACPRCKNDGYAAADRDKAQVDTRKFDAHDLTGIWSGSPADLSANGTPLDVKAMPPFTPYGQKLYDASLSDSSVWNSKDPMNVCDPMGFPRSLAYNYGIEFIRLPGRTLEFFEQGHFWRDIWTDGRKLPPDPPIPRFFGYAVGHWEGDTFVVESNGYDEKAWLDADNGRHNPQKRQGGFPHSDEMRIEERYKRLNYGLLQVELTIIDPRVYTAPWKTGPAMILLSPNSELAEHTCVPSDQMEYNKLNMAPGYDTEK